MKWLIEHKSLLLSLCAPLIGVWITQFLFHSKVNLKGLFFATGIYFVLVIIVILLWDYVTDLKARK